MDVLALIPQLEYEPRKTYVAEYPIDFKTWLEVGEELDTELVKGVLVDRMAAKYPHEWLFMWLAKILGNFVDVRELGIVLGSRTAVKITNNDGRLPDILFVRADNVAIIHNDAIYGVPDLVIEIVSDNDRPFDLIPLETDYRTIGVPEIVFIDPKKKRVRYVHNSGNGYEETFRTTGRLEFACIPGFWIEIEWLFAEKRPVAFDVTRQLIEEAAEKDIEKSLCAASV